MPETIPAPQPSGTPEPQSEDYKNKPPSDIEAFFRSIFGANWMSYLPSFMTSVNAPPQAQATPTASATPSPSTPTPPPGGEQSTIAQWLRNLFSFGGGQQSPMGAPSPMMSGTPSPTAMPSSTPVPPEMYFGRGRGTNRATSPGAPGFMDYLRQALLLWTPGNAAMGLPSFMPTDPRKQMEIYRMSQSLVGGGEPKPPYQDVASENRRFGPQGFTAQVTDPRNFKKEALPKEGVTELPVSDQIDLSGLNWGVGGGYYMPQMTTTGTGGGGSWKPPSQKKSVHATASPATGAHLAGGRRVTGRRNRPPVGRNSRYYQKLATWRGW